MPSIVFGFFLMLHLALLPVLAFGATISGRVLGPDGNGIAQAVVFVQALPVGTSLPEQAQQAVMDQVHKTFVPGVLPVTVGSTVYFPNHDQIHHHVYSFSRTKSFELPLYKGEEAPPVLFDKAGVVKIGCNIHDWMSAIILVLPNTHFTTTDADGRFTLSGLQPGAYSLMAWHPQSRDKVADIAQKVQLTASNVELTFHLSLADERSRPAMRGSRWDQ